MVGLADDVLQIELHRSNFLGCLPVSGPRLPFKSLGHSPQRLQSILIPQSRLAVSLPQRQQRRRWVMLIGVSYAQAMLGEEFHGKPRAAMTSQQTVSSTKIPSGYATPVSHEGGTATGASGPHLTL